MTNLDFQNLNWLLQEAIDSAVEQGNNPSALDDYNEAKVYLEKLIEGLKED